MPVLIPIIAGGAAYFGSTIAVGAMVSAGMVAAGSIAATIAGVVVGAVVGAAVGAIGALATGGDIGKGALMGAFAGAIGGGFAGFNAAAPVPDAVTMAAPEVSSLNEISSISGGGAGAGGGVTDSAMGAAITTGGQMVTGFAQGEAAAEQSAQSRADADKQRQEDFLNRMEEIRMNHSSRLAEIGVQGDQSLALADKNNAASMAQLNTRIGADKATVDAANADRDKLTANFNESIMGTDANLFNRPTLDVESELKNDQFASGFDEAVAQKLTPEQILELQQQQTA